MTRALVLEEIHKLALRDIALDEPMGPRDVRIAIKTVGVCGSDVHYYTRGAIGPFVVKAPMILGHEASGVVIETGGAVEHLKIGDRVCMEPGVPDPTSKASRLGQYNLDPAITFWATPPYHGILRPTVVHPADFTFKLPDNVSFAAAAMVEPLAVGVHATVKARITPGDTAVVIGAGPIGLVTLLAAFAAGCARVFISDVDEVKLAIAAALARVPGSVIPVNVRSANLAEAVMAQTEGWGADVLFECAGSERAAADMFDALRPGGCAVMVGLPQNPFPHDVAKACVKEIRIEHVFRYAHVFPRCVAMLAAGTIDVAPLITETFAFEDSINVFELAASQPKGSVKMQIEMPDI